MGVDQEEEDVFARRMGKRSCTAQSSRQTTGDQEQEQLAYYNGGAVKNGEGSDSDGSSDLEDVPGIPFMRHESFSRAEDGFDRQILKRDRRSEDGHLSLPE